MSVGSPVWRSNEEQHSQAVRVIAYPGQPGHRERDGSPIFDPRLVGFDATHPQGVLKSSQTEVRSIPRGVGEGRSAGTDVFVSLVDASRRRVRGGSGDGYDPLVVAGRGPRGSGS